MKFAYCKKCLVPNSRPNGKFNKNGICIPCEFYERSKKDNYEKRFYELKNILSKIKKKNKNSQYDCLVGVSGGKDSTRQALWVRDKLGLNPLLVSVVYPPRQISEVGVKNLSNLTKIGFDTLCLGPAPILSKQLVKYAFYNFGNWLKATELALFSGVPQIAVEKKIPLILWGENPALQVGDHAILGSSIWDGNNLIRGNTLSGGDLSWFLKVAKSMNKLNMYKFPDKKELNKSGVKTIFLGPAWENWSSENNAIISLAHGLSYRDDKPENTGDLIKARMVDEDWTIINMLLKYYKFGFSRGTEQASVLIRSGQISREEGVKIAEKYDTACSKKYILSFCKYLSIREYEFWSVLKKFTNKKLFDVNNKIPKKKFKVGYGLI
tara:strand:- start:160 stop:1299 length:1140 start_codon:yes stop_codon:yes gene_type:complete